MKAYVVIAVRINTGHKNVSQEAYTTLEKAQEFCEKRFGKIRKIDEFTFIDDLEEFGYEIREITIV